MKYYCQKCAKVNIHLKSLLRATHGLLFYANFMKNRCNFRGKKSPQITKIFPKAKVKMIAANRADVYQTFGSNKKIVNHLNLTKFTNINYGLRSTIKWFQENKVYKLI